MAAETTRARNPAGHAGLINNLFALLNDVAAFMEARLAIFVEDSKFALVQLLVLGACLVAAILFTALGYIFLLGSVIFAIAQATDASWITIALCTAGVHFALAVLSVIIGWTRATKPPYRKLTSELQKDREWIRNLDQASRPDR